MAVQVSQFRRQANQTQSSIEQNPLARALTVAGGIAGGVLGGMGGGPGGAVVGASTGAGLGATLGGFVAPPKINQAQESAPQAGPVAIDKSAMS